jgi:hypothetical protein
MPARADAAKVEGTTWTGTETAFGKDLKIYRFLPGGILDYEDSSGIRFRIGTWQQNGAEVTWETNQHYVEYSGIIRGNGMFGKAHNCTTEKCDAHSEVHHAWTWELTLRGPIPSEELAEASSRQEPRDAQACAHGYVAACKNLEKRYRTACDGGDMKGCANLGSMYANKEIYSNSHNAFGYDFPEAIRLYKKACNVGEFETALDLFTSRCDNGENLVCTHLGKMYELGWCRGVPTNNAKALRVYSKVCDSHMPLWPSGCVNLGLMYANGLGVPKHKAKALSLFNKACDAGEQLGCTILKSNDLSFPWGDVYKELAGLKDNRSK